jgi:hypothetical protein
MVVVVDGARFVRAGRFHRLLRRTLVVGGLVAAGWLLSLLFASTTAAADEPADETSAAFEQPAEEAEAAQGEFATMISGVSATVTPTVEALSENVSAKATTVAAHSTEVTGKAAAPAPTPTSTATTNRTAQLARPAPSTAEPAAPPRVPEAPPATPALSTSAAVAPEHPPRAAAVETPHDRTVAEHDRAHAKEHGPAHPVESPAPVAPGSTAVSSAHDNTGGARSALGAPVESTPAPPPSAGFTSRGLAGDATGRVAGLPATSPD